MEGNPMLWSYSAGRNDDGGMTNSEQDETKGEKVDDTAVKIYRYVLFSSNLVVIANIQRDFNYINFLDS